MKRTLAFLLSMTLVFTAASCSSHSKGDTSGEKTAVTEVLSQKQQLISHMTENERSRIKVGELTVLDHAQKERENIVPDDGVYLELWTDEDWVDYLKKCYEEAPENFEDGDLEQIIETSRPYFDELQYAYVSGENVNMVQLIPPIGYDGGELKLREPCPYFCYADEDGNFRYTDIDNNSFTEEEYHEKQAAFLDEEHYLTFADFEEFKPYLKNTLMRMNNTFMTFADKDEIEEKVEHDYKNVIAVWEAVINDDYKTIPAGTSEKYWEDMNDDITGTWEIDRDKIEAIAPYVKEYSIYDEQLDTNFIVHVTLPPDFDKDKIYPAYVLTDGVWRFNNSADLRKAMEEGKASDVIIVSIGYDYSIDGTNDEYRIKFFCDRCEDFLNFITDDLMPYLGEEYNIDFGDSTLYGHSLGGTFAHYAVFNSDKYENQPFKNYIIGSPVFWSPGFLPYTDGDEFRHEYGYFDRNDSLDKNIFVCGGADEDSVYEEYYNGNDSTLEGIQHLMERLEGYGVSTAECKIYPNSEHYQFIPEMLVEMLEKYYPAN